MLSMANSDGNEEELDSDANGAAELALAWKTCVVASPGFCMVSNCGGEGGTEGGYMPPQRGCICTGAIAMCDVLRAEAAGEAGLGDACLLEACSL